MKLMHEIARQNVEAYPALLQTLADVWCVDVSSLHEYGIGYLPAVKFKKGTSSKGWYTWPERDHTGEITGIGLRSIPGRDGEIVKAMYPGSKRGMMLPMGDGGKRYSKYKPGKDNWVRAMDSGQPCPICSKPDGCLLSAECPDDPAAVICCRVDRGSDRVMELGFLHILKRSGRRRTTSLLPESVYPKVCVEGLSDAVAAYDLGFVAVGRPNWMACPGLRTIFRGERVLIVGDNDESGVGEKGVKDVFSILTGVAEPVRLLPPEGFKDLRDWKTNSDLDADGLVAYASTMGEATVLLEFLPDNTPLTVANQWLQANYFDGNSILLRKHQREWYEYMGSHYRLLVDPDILRGGLYTWLEGRRYAEGEDGGLKTYIPTKSNVTNTLDALTAPCTVRNSPPCWLDGRTLDPRNSIVFENGIMAVDQYLDGAEHYMIETTPAFFNTTCLPHKFDPDAKAPAWMDYLDSTFEDSQDGRDKIALLQEWFGYNLIPDNRYEKMMMFLGKSRTGKGVALTGLRTMLGREQIASTKFASLSEKFGLQPLLGKLAAIMPDARLPRNSDSMLALETILAVVGNDGVDVRRMHIPTLPDVKLSVRFTLATNELPELPDFSHALEARLLLMHFEQCFLGRENRDLKDYIEAEAVGIVLWALEGLRRLRANDGFTMPESSLPLFDDFRRVSSPITDFVEDCCTVHEDAFVTVRRLYEIWAGWCKERGLRAGHQTRFCNRIPGSFDGVVLTNNPKTLYGIGVTPYAEKVFG